MLAIALAHCSSPLSPQLLSRDRDEPIEPLDRPNSGANGVGGYRHVIAYVGDAAVGCCRWRLETAVIPPAALGAGAAGAGAGAGTGGGAANGAGGGVPAVVAVVQRLLVVSRYRRKGYGAALLKHALLDVADAAAGGGGAALQDALARGGRGAPQGVVFPWPRASAGCAFLGGALARFGFAPRGPPLEWPVNFLQNTISDRTHCIAQLRARTLIPAECSAVS